MRRSSVPLNVSSGSDGDAHGALIDERSRKRKLSNRESARRSRMKKQQHMEGMLNQIDQLKKQNNEITQSINAITPLYDQVELENNVLRAQMSELNERLDSLNNILCIVGDGNGLGTGLPEVPNHLMNPWQLPCPTQPIMASANMNMFSGFGIDIPEEVDPLLEPWQLPCPSHPIMASASMNMFEHF